MIIVRRRHWNQHIGTRRRLRGIITRRGVIVGGGGIIIPPRLLLPMMIVLCLLRRTRTTQDFCTRSVCIIVIIIVFVASSARHRQALHIATLFVKEEENVERAERGYRYRGGRKAFGGKTQAKPFDVASSSLFQWMWSRKFLRSPSIRFQRRPFSSSSPTHHPLSIFLFNNGKFIYQFIIA